MNISEGRSVAWKRFRALVVTAGVLLWASPVAAQNKKNSWEVYLYFGSFYSNQVPYAKQFGEITTLRADPIYATDPTDPNQIYVPNLGHVGGDQSGDPNYPIDPNTSNPGGQYYVNPCNGSNTSPYPAGYEDECDNDQEARWIYNAKRIETNGEIQADDSEFSLGIRAGYNITRHFEVEFDLGFGKQRLNLTQNLDPLLQQSVNIADPNDPVARQLAEFYEFTWANYDYWSVASPTGQGEHPNVVASRKAFDSTYDIPMYFPTRYDEPGYLLPAGETFDDVTGFVNRVFQDPTAWRNRGDQINIDDFTVSLSLNYNFNTKADSRFVPYVSVGFGRWIRNFDSPWDGNDTNFYLGGGGLRFFINEIFAFRADARYVAYADKSFTIEGQIDNFNLEDRQWAGIANTCARDQRDLQPPCLPDPVPQSNWFFPNFQGGGGTAIVEIEAGLDDFYEIRLGFDVILGGK